MPMSQQADDLKTGSAPEDGGRWEFDENVAAAFDDMLERSIPNYADMRRVTTDAVSWVLESGGTRNVVDLGASRGSALAPIVERHAIGARYFATDVSEPMLTALRERYVDLVASRWMKVWRHDLRDGFPALGIHGHAAAVLLILTLQFVPIEYRQTLLRQIYENLRPNGALIMVEKVLGEAEETNRLLCDLYYGHKRENGYTQEAIDRKRLSLEGVLVPLTAGFNEELLRKAGFDLVEVIWAWCNFRGWIAVKR